MTEHRASWIAALAKLTTPHDAERAASAMLAYVTFMVDLPDQAFTLASMRHVAMQERRMMIPDLREVLTPLEAWWRENRPSRTALPAPTARAEQPRQPPTDAERAAVRQALVKFRSERSAAEAVVVPIRARHLSDDELAQARAQLRTKAGIG